MDVLLIGCLLVTLVSLRGVPGDSTTRVDTCPYSFSLLLLYSPSCIRAQYSSKLLPIITQGDSDRCNRDRGSLGLVLLARLHGVKRRSGCIHGGGEGGGDKQERGANHGGCGLRDATAAAGVAHGGGGGGSRE